MSHKELDQVEVIRAVICKQRRLPVAGRLGSRPDIAASLPVVCCQPPPEERFSPWYVSTM